MGTMAAALVRLLGAQGQHVEDAAASMHASIAGRVFRALGPLGAPTRAVHDTVAEGVHGLVRASLGGTGWLGGVLAEAVPDEVLLASPRGRTLVGAVLGLIGDRVREEEPDLAWPTVLLGQGAVSAGEVVVLLHGLCETDLAWSMGATVARPGLAEVLDEPGRSVLVARMNTGLRAGTAAGHSWVERCDTLVTLGTPHLGAPLEKAVAVLVKAGAPVPEVAAVTNWFEQRSAGIRDLRHGVDDDGAAPGVSVVAAPLPKHVRLHTVGATLRGPAGRVVGDGLVLPGSAHARSVRRPVQARRGPVLDVEGSHFDLLTDPAVTSHVRAIIDVGSPALERT